MAYGIRRVALREDSEGRDDKEEKMNYTPQVDYYNPIFQNPPEY